MDSRVKTRIDAATLVAVIGLIAAQGCEPSTCRAQTNDDLARIAAFDDCPDVIVHNTSLTSLAGLEAMTAPKPVSVAGNAALTDVSAASGARSLDLGANDLLTSVDLTLHEGISVQQPLESVKLKLDPRTELPGRVFFTRTPDVLELRCVTTCRVRVDLADVNSVALTIDPSMTTDLVINESMSDWQVLEGAGVPASVQFYGAQDVAVLRDYRAFLESVGFVGTFELCVEETGVCEDVAAEP